MAQLEKVLSEFSYLNLSHEKLENELHSFIQQKYPNSNIEILTVQKMYSSHYGYEYFILFENDGITYKETTSQALFNEIIKGENK